MSQTAYLRWMIDESLPFWTGAAQDADSGLFWEKLHLDGRPDRAAELRLRTQMRQVYVFAHAPILGVADASPAVSMAERALEKLRAVAWAPDGRPGWVHRVSLDGRVLDGRRDLYDHAFVLHALAWVLKATGKPLYAHWIDETWSVIDTAMAAPSGGWAESDRHETPRRQNPHMHLFEACLALYEATGEPRHLARAGEIFGLFRNRFFQEETGALLEFFGPHWERGEDFGTHRLEPGHKMEWVWLLRRYERATGRSVADLCARLFATGEKLGLDAASGFLVDEVDHAGKRLVDGRRLWLQTEYLKALIVEAEARADDTLAAKADALCEAMLATYLAEVPRGCWRDRFDLSGRLIADHIPASILYHVFAPVVEILRVRGELPHV